MAQGRLRAVFYARVSTEEEMQVNALAKQIQENRDVISQMGWELVDEYIDEGKTGTKAKGRKEYERLFADMTEEKFDIVVIKSQDRLMRDTHEWYKFLDRLVNNDLQLFMYLDNSFYTPEDKFILGIKAQMAEEYSRDLSKKLNNANQRRIERALRGEPLSAMGNGKSLGYAIKDGVWVQVPEQIEVCKLIWDLYEKYDGLRKVCTEINNRGYKNSVGKPFTSESIGRILKNEKAKGVIVLGKYHHNFEKKKIDKRAEEELVRVPAPELAYVSEERFERVQERLRAKTGISRGKKVGRDPLSGKMFCIKCGGGMWRRESSRIDKNGEKKKYYHWDCSNRYARGICTGVHTTTLAIRKVYQELTSGIVVNRDAVKNELVAWLERLKKELSANRDTETIRKEIDRLERRKNKLTEAYLDEILPKAEYKIKYTEIESQIDSLRASLAPIEEDDEIKEIEYTLAHIDSEIDDYISTIDFEESKVDWLIEHTNKITVLENSDLIIELDLIAGVIIAGKDFLLFVHDSMPQSLGGIYNEKARFRKAFIRQI